MKEQSDYSLKEGLPCLDESVTLDILEHSLLKGTCLKQDRHYAEVIKVIEEKVCLLWLQGNLEN